MTLELPPQFVQNIKNTFDGGQKWLEQLPHLLDEICADWQLVLGSPFLLSYNFDHIPVAPVPYESLEHVTLTRDFLRDPQAFLRHL